MSSRNLKRFPVLENLLLGSGRPVILVLFALATAFMVAMAAQLRIDAGFKKQLPLTHEYMQTFLDYETEFGGANRVLVAVMMKDGAGDMFNKDFFRTIEAVTEEVKAISEVDNARVRSIFTPNTRFVEIVEDGFAGGNVIPADFSTTTKDFDPTPEQFGTIRSNIVKAGIVGRLVANDFSGAIVSAELVPEGAGGVKLDYQLVGGKLEEIRAQHEQGNVTIHIIGFAKIVSDIASGAKSVIAFFGVAILLTFVLLWLYSSSLKLSLVVVSVCIVAVAWQLGSLHLLGFGIDPMNMLTPFLVFAIGVSHGVQMINSWRNEVLFGGAETAHTKEELLRHQGVDSQEAAKRTFARLVIPGSIALASDCIGFITILFIPIQIIRELAITASLGVAVIILTNLILLPNLLSYLSLRNREAQRQKAANKVSRSDRMWYALAGFSKPVPAAIAILIGASLFVWGQKEGSKLQIGDSQPGVAELRPEARYNQDANLISTRFSLGVDLINIIAEVGSDSCTESFATMEQIDRFAWHMSNVPGVQQVVTLPWVGKVVNAGWNEGNLRWRALTRNSSMTSQSIGSIETDTGLLNDGCTAMPIMLFTADHKAETISRVVDAVKVFREANANEFVNFRIENDKLEKMAAESGETGGVDAVNLRLATGNVGVMAATNEKVSAAQHPMLQFVYAAVIGLCLLTYGRVRRTPNEGLVGKFVGSIWYRLRVTSCIVLPLMLVTVLSNALMVHLGIGLKVNTLPVVALGVGIGVDYAIYIYSRMEEFLRDGDSLVDAYAKALKLTGTAVLFTGLTLAVGVGTWIFSELQFQADMGILLSFMFVMNMIGAVLLLPALLRWLTRPREQV